MKVLTVSYQDPIGSRKFAGSLRDTGFAVLRDHPISSDLIFEVYDEWEAFFKSQTKFDYLFKNETQAGYFPFKSENAKGVAQKDLKEFYHYYPWNGLPQNFSDKTTKLYRELNALAVTLLDWIALETPDAIRKTFSMPLSQMSVDSPKTLLRILHYPPLTGSEEENSGAIRAAAHEDINLITLLPAATAPGLQVKDRQGQWHDVPCDPGQIVINCGDMLQLASLGHFASTTHRVVNPAGSEASLPRFSMPLFLHPWPEVSLSPEKTAGTYLNERLRELGLKK